MSWLEHRFYSNSVLDWIVALGIALVSAAVFFYVNKLVLARLRAYSNTTSTRIDDFAAEVLSGTHALFLVIIATYVGSQYLEFPNKIDRLLNQIVVVSLIVQGGIWGGRGISWWFERTLELKRETDAAGATTMSVIGFVVRLVLWTLVGLMILDNLGVNITALIASLGIGGIAVALAAQNILGDMLASLSIALDKPFAIGDFIIVGDVMGTIEHIGVKTTHIRSLTGEQIIMPNADLLKSRIRNYKRMKERRVVFSFGVTYETDVAKLEKIPSMVRGIIEAQAKTRFDRAHFMSYGDSSLNFEVVYYVLDPDYNLYMDTQQAINLALLRGFSENNISFAYPTRVIHIPQMGAAMESASK